MSAILPDRAGLGLKPAHFGPALESVAPVGWVEVHPENYMGTGGPPHRWLAALRDRWPLSLHAVGLSLGGLDPLDEDHLARLAALVDRYRPALVSDHLSWSVLDGIHHPDLLPVPRTEEALAHLVPRVQRVQERLGRPILVENPSSYLRFAADALGEGEFLAALCARAGCGLLLDVNNVFVSARNLGADPLAWLLAMPLERVGEIHVAGHAVERHGNRVLLVDDHGSAVAPVVWALLAAVLRRTGPRPVLVEWDTAVPPLEVLAGEAARADALLASFTTGAGLR